MTNRSKFMAVLTVAIAANLCGLEPALASNCEALKAAIAAVNDRRMHQMLAERDRDDTANDSGGSPVARAVFEGFDTCTARYSNQNTNELACKVSDGVIVDHDAFMRKLHACTTAGRSALEFATSPSQPEAHAKTLYFSNLVVAEFTHGGDGAQSLDIYSDQEGDTDGVDGVTDNVYGDNGHMIRFGEFTVNAKR